MRAAKSIIVIILPSDKSTIIDSSGRVYRSLQGSIWRNIIDNNYGVD